MVTGTVPSTRQKKKVPVLAKAKAEAEARVCPLLPEEAKTKTSQGSRARRGRLLLAPPDSPRTKAQALLMVAREKGKLEAAVLPRLAFQTATMLCLLPEQVLPIQGSLMPRAAGTTSKGTAPKAKGATSFTSRIASAPWTANVGMEKKQFPTCW